MKIASRSARRGFCLTLLPLVLLVCWQFAPSAEALTIGRRRIQCSTPVGGNPDTDALMDPRPNLPYIMGFVGFQAFLPTLGKCPPADMIQPPWYSGIEGVGGICPPEYYNLGASLPGLAIIGAAAAWAFSIEANRLLVTKKGLGTASVNSGVSEFEEEVLFSEVESWFMTPVGLVVKSPETTKFFPLTWDQKSLEAVLEQRIPN